MIQPHVPAWVKDAVFYQIFPDRFAKSDRVLKPRNLEAWDAPPTVFGYKGGDLLGVVEHLDHLHDLGITAIYFTPVFQSASNHRYHTHDYYQIDPLLGGDAAFETLRAETARRGIRLVLDGVFNHASRGNFYFNDILENGPASPWIDWFTIHDWPLHPYDASQPANYEAWVGLRALPRWNTEHPQVREYIMRVAEHWLRRGIDGWRLDVPFEITSPGFWHEFRDRVKAVNSDAYIVGEVWWDARNYLRGDQFDAVMNYLFTAPVTQFTGREQIRYDLVRRRSIDPYPPIDARQFADRLDQLLGLYQWETNLGQLNLLGSHDTARFRTIVGNDERSVRLATLLLLTFPGAPSIYYGDEIGLEGENDPDCRRTIPWDRPAAWNHEALAYHREFIALRRAHPALRTGAFHRLWPAPDDARPEAGDVYAFARSLDGAAFVVALNNGDQTRTVGVPLGGLPAGRDGPRALVGDAALRRHEDRLEMTLPPRDAVVVAL